MTTTNPTPAPPKMPDGAVALTPLEMNSYKFTERHTRLNQKKLGPGFAVCAKFRNFTAL